MIDNNKNIICENIIKDISNVIKVSRLEWKNIVYKIIDINGNEYALKIFKKNITDFHDRYKTELKINKLFQKLNISTPNIIKSGLTINGDFYILYEWINGETLKTKILNQGEIGLEYFKTIIQNIYNINQTQLDLKDLPICKDSLINHNMSGKLKLDLIFNKCRKTNNFERFKSTYLNLLNYTKNTPSKYILINSDISCKEFIFANNMYHIDYESYCFGNINADFAGLFYSSVNGFFEDKNKVLKYYKFFKEQKDFNNNIFLFYLSERVIMAEMLAKEQVSIQEYNFFIDFILENAK